MNIKQMELIDIKPYPGNAKKHDETQIKNVMQSIKDFGVVQPLVVDKDNVLIIGHCRLIASKRLKLKEVPVVRLEDLSEEEAQKLRLLDNKLNESEWDFSLLSEQIPELDFSEFDIDWGIDFDDDIPQIEKKELAPYKKVHYLLTIDVNDHDKIIDLIEQIRDMGVVEIESTLN